MRIGLISGEYPPMEGGVGDFTRELAQALAEAGHELHIITNREARPDQPDAPRPRPWRLREPVDLGYALLHPRARRWRWGDVNTIAEIAERYALEILNIQYQAAAYNMRSAAINLAPWRLRGLAPVVVTFHDLRVPYLFPKAGPLRRLAVRFTARRASGVITTNPADAERLVAELSDGDAPRPLAGAPPDAPSVLRLPAGPLLAEIPIGSNIAPRPADPARALLVRRRLRIAPAAPLLAYFGFLNESKGADTLVRALALLLEEDAHAARRAGEAHLVFVGASVGGSDSANNSAFLHELRALVEASGLQERVHWTGFLPEREVSDHLHAADLVVLPYRDGASLRRGTLMAALAHGRPTVSTRPPDAAPASPLVHGENIWLVPPQSTPELADALRHLLAHPALRARLAAGAAALAPRFSWQRIAAETAAFYQRVRATSP
ncbi:MAG: glycosyltransferase family 4 protein [Candidatus Promineifilaceae bacterium]|nr:glycosyltransferase family 4 protein [Candidatus Promineifilaceae bacterium]